MKSKIQSLLWSVGGILVVVAIIIAYNWNLREQDNEVRERKAEARMQQHNHLMIGDLISLQSKPLDQIQGTLGLNDNIGKDKTWGHTITSKSKSGFTYSNWDSYSPKTEADPFSCLNGIKCFDINGSTLIEYTTNDPAYIPSSMYTLREDRNFKLFGKGKDSEGSGATYRWYVSDGKDVAVVLMSSPNHKESHDVILVASVKNTETMMNGQLDLSLR